MIFNLHSLLENIFLFVNYTYGFYIWAIFSSILQISLILLYLIEFKFLYARLIIWILFLISFFMVLFISILNSPVFFDIIYCINDNDIHLHGHVSLDKGAGQAIGQGISTVGTQIGLGASIVGVSGAVGKAVTKSGMPPLQKAGFILGSGLVAGIGHSWISNVNRKMIISENATNLNNNINPTISRLVEDNHISPLQEFLFNGQMMNYVLLGIVYLIIIQLVFKLYFKHSVNLNLSKYLGNNFNDKTQYYLNKIILLNKRMSIFWIWFGFVVIIFGSSIEMYALFKICINLDSFINAHISFNPNFENNSTHISDSSIKNILLNLKVVNYVSLVSIVLLLLQIIFKFHLHKDINNIYIWLVLLLLILSLAFSAYTYADLYTNVDSYVNIYNNLRNQ